MYRFALAVGFLALVGCRDPQGAQRLAVLKELSTAAQRGDMEAVRKLSADSVVPLRLTAMSRKEPRILKAMERVQRARSVSHHADTVRVTYVMVIDEKTEDLNIGSVGSGESLKVYYIGFPDRM